MKPILFNTDMVRAILDGRKTVTRRVVKGADPLWGFDGMETNPAMTKNRKNGEEYPVDMLGLWAIFESEGYPEYPMIKAPYHLGDILYVRETWARYHEFYVYKTDCQDTELLLNVPGTTIKWRPSIHMPKEAARIFLRMKNVSVERLQEIDDDKIEKEGIEKQPILARWVVFKDLWDRTIKPADRAEYGWEANPFVWVIEFEQISREEAMKA